MKSQEIQNKVSLVPFYQKLNNGQQVVQILIVGDSHIQGGSLSNTLKTYFQNKYGNAGRGLVFPYNVANTNSPTDFKSYTDQKWQTFRLVHHQRVLPEIGISGFVIANEKKSFIEISFQGEDDDFDKVVMFHSSKMDGESIDIYTSNVSLNDYVTKTLTPINYTLLKPYTFHELMSEFYTTTTKLLKQNGNSIQNPKVGKSITVDETNFSFNPEFYNHIAFLKTKILAGIKTNVDYPYSQHRFLLQTNDNVENIFYGFQFLKNVDKGVVINSVGVNGAKYSDYLKHKIQQQQLQTINPDLLIVALGTNESLTNIKKEEFLNNVAQYVKNWRKYNPNLPILLLPPTDNNANPKRAKQIRDWTQEACEKQKVAFFDLWQAMGGYGYFSKAQKNLEASGDGVHFLPLGYEKQADEIWNAFMKGNPILGDTLLTNPSIPSLEELLLNK